MKAFFYWQNKDLTISGKDFIVTLLGENYNEVILNEKKLIIKELENFEHQKIDLNFIKK